MQKCRSGAGSSPATPTNKIENMKPNKSLFQQLHQANEQLNQKQIDAYELVKQKQSDINELVEFIKAIGHYIPEHYYKSSKELIQKHTKK